MASRHKTFADGEVLTASDVNDILNPTTSDHVPYAVAAGETTLTFSSSNTSATKVVTFPAGRFTKYPMVFVQMENQSWKICFSVTATSATQCSIVGMTADGSSMSTTIGVGWLAVQMGV